MLSASTVSSTSSSAFTTNSSASTPSSQYSMETSRKINTSPLTDLIDTEKSYLETLRIIDLQIAPLWKRQAEPSNDFTDLLSYVHDIYKANKRFCAKLVKIASNPQVFRELGDVLMQWVDDMEVPYANFSRSFISDLNQRQDILDNGAIQDLLEGLSANVPYELTLESLFNAPNQQLRYYKMLYSRLLDNSDAGRADHKILLKANKRIDMIMIMAQRTIPRSTSLSTTRKLHTNEPPAARSFRGVHPLPHINTSLQTQSSLSDSDVLEQTIDCSRVVDIFTETHMQYQLHISPTAKVALKNSFVLLSDKPSASTVRVHLILTSEVLLVCAEYPGPKLLSLIYPPINNHDIEVKSANLEREVIGEYIVQLSISNQKYLTLRADSKEIRNLWLGLESSASSNMVLATRSLTNIALNIMAQLGDTSDTIMTVLANYHRKYTTNTTNTTNTNTNTNTNSERPSLKEINSNQFQEKTPIMQDTSTDVYNGHLFDELSPESPYQMTPSSLLIGSFNNMLIDFTQLSGKINTRDHLKEIQTQSTENSPVTVQSSSSFTKEMDSGSNSIPISTTSSVKYELEENRSTGAWGATTLPSVRTVESQLRSPIKGLYHGALHGSPRLVEVRQGISPVAMQAVTEINEYAIPKATSSSQHQYQQPVHHDSAHGRIYDEHIQAMAQSEASESTYTMHHQPTREITAYASTAKIAAPSLPSLHSISPPTRSTSRNVNILRETSQKYTEKDDIVQYQFPLPVARSPQPMQSKVSKPPAPEAPPMIHSLSSSSTYNSPQPFSHAYSSRPQQNHFNSSDELYSLPHSSDTQEGPSNDTHIVYSSNQCEVFHWKDKTWYAAEGTCLLQIRFTHYGRACLTVQIQSTGHLYLNAWILPSSIIRQPSETDVSITFLMGHRRENYLIHFRQPHTTSAFLQALKCIHPTPSSTSSTTSTSTTTSSMTTTTPSPLSSSLSTPTPTPTPSSFHTHSIMKRMYSQHQEQALDSSELLIETLPNTLHRVMHFKCKLFLKNETSNWSPFGSVSMQISQQVPSKRMYIDIENDKNKLVSSSIFGSNVEKMGSKKITFLLKNEKERTSRVYMIQLKDEATAVKAYDYLRIRNEGSW